MNNSLSPDRLGALSTFRRLANWTLATTALLIVVGGVVRVSDSGLGCGPPGSGHEGWPLCGGRLVPLIQQHAVIEFTHRALAGVVAVLIGLLVWRAWRGLRGERPLVRGSIAAAVLVAAQAGLGGLVVDRNLKDVLVAAHLGLAMLLIGLLIGLSWLARERLLEGRSEQAGAGGGSPGLRRLATLCCALVLATIVAGGYVAGTEEEGAVNGAGGGAHLACGDQFPKCNGSLFPVGKNALVDAQLNHRALMALATLAILALIGLAYRRGAGAPVFWQLGLILIAQVLLGAINVWAGKHPGLVVAHLTLGTLLWSTVLVAALRLRRPPAP